MLYDDNNTGWSALPPRRRPGQHPDDGGSVCPHLEVEVERRGAAPFRFLLRAALVEQLELVVRCR